MLADGGRVVTHKEAELEEAGPHLCHSLELAHLQGPLKSLERSERLWHALFAISELADSDCDMHDTLRGVHAVVCDLMYAENFYVVRYDVERDSMRFLFYADVADPDPPANDVEIAMESLKHSPTWYLLRDSRPLRGSAAELRARVSGPLTVRGPDRKDWLGVPMLRDGRARGAVVAQCYRQGNRFTDEDQALLEFVGSHVLAMIERRQWRRDLERLVHQRTLDLDEANRVLQREIVERCRSTEVQHRAYSQLKLRFEERTRELNSRNAELEIANAKLKDAQHQAIQSEKLASIGQLAAGVAHEINNPIGYVNSNLGTLQGYLSKLLTAIDAFAQIVRQGDPATVAAGDAISKSADIAYLASDAPQLIKESRDGIDRVCKIIRDLKDFSRRDHGEAWVRADVHEGLMSTLNIVSNQLKYKAQIVRTFGDLPLIECLPSELNQVFLNILMNAGQAIKQSGIITVTTGCSADKAWIAIGDDGEGIPADVLPRIFDPFFTTKPVGTGTGLGLAISYGIVAKHHGNVEVTSVPDQGTLFRIELPVEQPR